jgi:hypothetical protein
LLNIGEGLEIEAFIEIEELELQQAVNVVGTSVRAVGSSQNVEGTSHQSSQRVSSLAQVVQEHTKSGQHQVEDWESEDAARDRDTSSGVRGYHLKAGSDPVGRS